MNEYVGFTVIFVVFGLLPALIAVYRTSGISRVFWSVVAVLVALFILSFWVL